MAQASFNSPFAALCLLGVILCSNLAEADGEHAMDCCLQVSIKQIPKLILASYRVQVKGEGCSLDAVIFRTKKGVDLCSPNDAPWVKDRQSFLDTRLKQCKGEKFKGKRCQGLKPKSD